MAVPTFNQAWGGGEQYWGKPGVAWQGLLATQGGNMTPEQRAYAEQQAQAGAGAVNPYQTGIFTPTAPAAGGGTQQGGGQTSTGSLVPQGIGQTAMTPSAQGGATVQTQFRDALLGQLQTNPNAVALTDPDIAPQARAFQNAQQRSQERAQQQLAEQSFAGGTRGTGAYGQQLAGLEQQRGESEAAFEAQLLADAKAQRLASLFEALGLAGGQITADEGLRLQRELGLGDLDIRRTDVAQDYALGQGQLSLGLLQAMLQNQQAENRLGFDIGQFGADLNFRSAFPFLK